MNLTELQICSAGEEVNSITKHVSFFVHEHVRDNPYILKRATGLDPEEIIRTYNDGPAFFRLRPKERVISMQIKLNPNYGNNISIGDLRDYLYRLIATNTKASTWNSDTKLELRCMSGSIYVGSLFGVISKLEADIFSNSPDVTIEFTCDDPFIRSVNFIDLSDSIQTNSSESHTYFNGITYNVESSFSCNDEKSTAPHGFQFEAQCISTPPSSETEPKKFIIWDSRNPLYYIFSATMDFQPGQVVHFSSEEDNRYFYTITNMGLKIDLLNSIYWGSIWPMLSPGDNFIEVSEGFNITAVRHRESYWGV